MPKKRNVSGELKFSDNKGVFEVYLPAVTTKEAIDKLLEEASFRKIPISMGIIKEKVDICRAGFLQQDSL